MSVNNGSKMCTVVVGALLTSLRSELVWVFNNTY